MGVVGVRSGESSVEDGGGGTGKPCIADEGQHGWHHERGGLGELVPAFVYGGEGLG